MSKYGLNVKIDHGKQENNHGCFDILLQRDLITIATFLTYLTSDRLRTIKLSSGVALTSSGQHAL